MILNNFLCSEIITVLTIIWEVFPRNMQRLAWVLVMQLEIIYALREQMSHRIQMREILKFVVRNSGIWWNYMDSITELREA